MRLFSLPPFFLPSAPLSKRHKLPKRTGVYYAIQWWRPWRPLYIGKAMNIRRRWQSHEKLKDLKPLFGVRLHCRLTRTYARAGRMESIEIRRYEPKFNRKKERVRQNRVLDAVDFLMDGFWMTVALALGLAIVHAL